MKSWKKSLTASAIVLLFLAGMLAVALTATAEDDNTDSGIPGIRGSEFTFGVILASAIGTNPKASGNTSVFNNAPWALTGYVLSKYHGSIHVWIVECSQVVLDLGFEPGDVVEIYCSASQVREVETGDYAALYGFTARGFLVRSIDSVLPAPFSY